MVSTFDCVWPLLGFTMWLDRDEATFVSALVSPLAEGNLKLSYMSWRSLTPKKFANYVCTLPPCTSVHRSLWLIPVPRRRDGLTIFALPWCDSWQYSTCLSTIAVLFISTYYSLYCRKTSYGTRNVAILSISASPNIFILLHPHSPLPLRFPVPSASRN